MHGNHSKELIASSQSSAPKTKSKIHRTRQKRGDGIDSKSPEGTRRMGPPFPIKSTQGLTNPSTKSTLKRRTEGEEHRGGGLENRTIHGHNTKATLDLTQVKGYLYPRDRSDRYAGPVRPVGWTGQTGARDRSDRLACSTPVHDLI